MPEIGIVICRHCNDGKPLSDFGGRKVTKQGYSTCNTCYNAGMRERRRVDPDPLRERWCRWRLKNVGSYREYLKRKHREVRLEVLRYYSVGIPHCACCGCEFIEFLGIDHVNGHGNLARKVEKRNYQSTYEYLKGEGFPLGYRVLCHNCNLSLGFYGYCPHEKVKEARP